MRVGVLGGGQLGRMLALAGYPLGHTFTFLDPSPDACAGRVGELVEAAYDDLAGLEELAARSDVVTYEFENVPVAAARSLTDEVKLWPPPAALEVAQDRVAEKRLFEKVGLPVARYVPVAGVAEVAAAVAAVGTPCLIKTRREGYDGKGQVRLDDPGRAEEAWVRLGSVPAVVEEVVDFDRELSALGVRARDGSSAFYPPVENHHAGGILRVSLAPAPGVPEAMRVRAEGYTRALMEELGYVGVLAVELFVVGGELYGNEMAPRVHNSGHYSIEGAVTSQFANHVRAVTGRPLGPTDPTGDTIMVNLIGGVPDEASLLGIPGAHLHLYGKRPRPGRKVGHVTLRLDDPERLREAFGRVGTLVPDTPDVLSRRPDPESLSGSRRSPI